MIINASNTTTHSYDSRTHGATAIRILFEVRAGYKYLALAEWGWEGGGRLHIISNLDFV